MSLVDKDILTKQDNITRPKDKTKTKPQGCHKQQEIPV